MRIHFELHLQTLRAKVIRCKGSPVSGILKIARAAFLIEVCEEKVLASLVLLVLGEFCFADDGGGVMLSIFVFVDGCIGTHSAGQRSSLYFKADMDMVIASIGSHHTILLTS